MDPIVAGIIAGLIGGVGVELVRGLFARKKIKAETNQTEVNATELITRAATSLIKPLEERIVKVEKRADRYAKRVVYLMTGIETLMGQLARNGCVPEWQPDEWDPNEDENVKR